MGKHDRVTEAMRSRIKEMSEAGSSVKSMAIELGVHTTTVIRHRADLGLSKPVKPAGRITKSADYRIGVMSCQGERVEEMAYALDLHPATVSKRRRELGLAPKRSKKFKFVSPQGEVVEVSPEKDPPYNTLASFCEKYGLIGTNMSQVWKGRFNQHKGWRKAE